MIKTRIYLLIFILPLVLMGCSNEQNENLLIVMDFFNLQQNFEKGDWLEIDNWRFEHYKTKPTNLEENVFPLPANIIQDSIGTKIKEVKVNSRNIAIQLSLFIRYINEEILSEDDPKYVIIDPHLITISGQLSIMKSDSTQISVKTSDNYPLRISKGSLK
ncbi:MAG: hypothetical protein WD053_08075 [Gracilimonas sp.]